MTVLEWLPRFRHVAADLERLAERESWPRERIEAFQLPRLNAVWSRAVRDVPHWRDLRAREALPPRFDSLDEFRERVPILEKDLVRDEPERFLAERPGAGAWRRTSGSTGSPMRIYWSRDGHRRVLRAQYRFFQSWGIDLFDPAAFAMRPQREAATPVGMGLERLTGGVRCRLRNRRWLWSDRLGADELRRLLDRMEGFAPVLLYGYSSLIALLVEEAERTGRRFPALRLVVLTSERASPAMVAGIEAALGVPAVVEYGATECGFLAGEDRDRALRVREDLAMIETLPRGDGRFDLVTTILVNPSFPLLRYAIEDVTERPLETPERGFAIMGAVGGRRDDFLVAAGGELVDSSSVEVIVGDRANVRRFRVRQARDGSTEVEVEIADLAAGLDVRRIEHDLTALLDGFSVRARAVAALDPDRSGKHRVVTSDRRAFLRPATPEGDRARAV